MLYIKTRGTITPKDGVLRLGILAALQLLVLKAWCCYVALFQAVAGLLADARHMVESARDEATNYRYNYGSSIPLKVSV